MKEDYEIEFVFIYFIIKSYVIWDKPKPSVDVVSRPMDKCNHHYSDSTGHIYIKPFSWHRGRQHAHENYSDMVMSSPRKGGYLGTRAMDLPT